MKSLITFLALFAITLSATAQTNSKTNDPTLLQIVDASCGQCNFGLKDKKGCDLAIKIDGKAYWVTGTDINSHGDAHSTQGLCNAVRKAQVAGEIIDGKFKVNHFKLLPVKSSKEGHEDHHHN